MRAGKLRHRITIEQATEARSSSGMVSEAWNTYRTRWAAIEAVAGSERFEADRHHAEVTHHITIRHTAGVVPKMRVVFGTRTFDIESVEDADGRGRFMLLRTREEV